MRIGFMVAAIFTLGSGALAEDHGRPTAILVSPIHEAQIVRGDDGKDHVEYELLVVNVFSEPVTLSSVAVLDPAGKQLMRIEGATLAADDAGQRRAEHVLAGLDGMAGLALPEDQTACRGIAPGRHRGGSCGRRRAGGGWRS